MSYFFFKLNTKLNQWVEDLPSKYFLTIIWPFMICCISICRVWIARTGSSPACRFILWMERFPSVTKAMSSSSRYSTLLVCSMMALWVERIQTHGDDVQNSVQKAYKSSIFMLILICHTYDMVLARRISDVHDFSPCIRGKVILNSLAIPHWADAVIIIAVLLLDSFLEVTCRVRVTLSYLRNQHVEIGCTCSNNENFLTGHLTQTDIWNRSWDAFIVQNKFNGRDVFCLQSTEHIFK